MIKQPVPKFYGVCKVQPNGDIKLRFDDPIAYHEYVNKHFKDGQQAYAIVKHHQKRKRTTGTPDEESNQNGYLWGFVLPPLCAYFGFTPTEMLDALRPLFFFKVSDKDPNIKRLRSTTEYKTYEWELIMEAIRVWALTEHGVRIPLPNEAVAGDDELEHESMEDTTKDPVNPLIELFMPVNPSYARLYANKSERKAMERLIKQHGTEKLKKVITFLPTSNANKYAPTITTPIQLERELGKLLAWAQKQKAKKKKIADLGSKK